VTSSNSQVCEGAKTSTMAFQVCEETGQAVSEGVIALFNQTRRHEKDLARFDWLYRQNPDGPAVVWTVRDASNGELAGFTVALPRRMLVDGRPRNCWNCADFSMDQRYRTLGPAIKLRRAAKDGVDAGKVDFLYAHPNARMEVIHTKVGHFKVGRMVRMARPLRSAPYLQEKLKSRALAAVGGLMIDPLLRISGKETRHRAGCTVRRLDLASFDQSFDLLFEEAAPRQGIIGIRDATYLNWRYARNPLYCPHVLIAEKNSRLRGYLVFVIDEGMAHVKDIFPPGDRHTARDLIAALLKAARREHVQSVSVIALESHPLLAVFEEFGFQMRSEGSSMYAYARPNDPWGAQVGEKGDWSLTVGDRDV